MTQDELNRFKAENPAMVAALCEEVAHKLADKRHEVVTKYRQFATTASDVLEETMLQVIDTYVACESIVLNCAPESALVNG